MKEQERKEGRGKRGRKQGGARPTRAGGRLPVPVWPIRVSGLGWGRAWGGEKCAGEGEPLHTAHMTDPSHRRAEQGVCARSP